MNGFDLDPEWWWLIGAAILGIAEILMPGVFLIWLAAAAAVTGFAALLGIPLAFQFGLFALLSIAAVTFGRRWYADHPVASSDPLLNDRAARLVGETVLVVTAIEGGQGRVKVGDGVWNARGLETPAGAHVRVTGTKSGCLIVEPIAALPPSN
ncbi:NfeD family protein [Allosphingosinicella flava]|uniref:NfeD family protein n=1 Tax=Allosphingosinicella flava TaxID=2771430 RepID=A0A7T2GKP8_9SPHN|nr:NfeD family protein [Sphingosinicella flava]QPQ55648.1 NfeD family protein [Sphingosinicella flava]